MERKELYSWLCEMNDHEMPTDERELLEKIDKRLAVVEMILIYVLQGHNS